MKQLMFLLSLALVLGACSGSKKAKSDGNYFLTGTKWNLIKIKDQMATVTHNSRSLELSLPDKKGTGTISGNGGCNSFSGNYNSEKGTNKINFSEIASTKMACEGEMMESKYFNALNSVNSYVISGKILKLYSGGDLVLTFEGLSTTN